MGLLDDAIREHLDLKRRSGGDPAEIERLEREALGPVRREPSAYGGSTAVSDEPPPYTDEPVTGAIEDVHTPEPEPLSDAPEEPRRPRRFLRGLSALSGAPAAEDKDDDYDPVQPLPSSERPQPSAPRREPPQPSPPRSEPPHLTLSGRTLPDEEPEASAPAPAAPAPAAPAPPAAPADEQATQVHRIEPAAPLEPEQTAASDSGPAGPPSQAPAADDEDPLEETPEFLQDTPEHDRLWFEQRPPRDFDFDS